MTTYAFTSHGQFTLNPTLHYNPGRNQTLDIIPLAADVYPFYDLVSLILSFDLRLERRAIVNRKSSICTRPSANQCPLRDITPAAFPSLLPSPQAIRYPTIRILSAVGGDPENGAARIYRHQGLVFVTSPMAADSTSNSQKPPCRISRTCPGRCLFKPRFLIDKTYGVPWYGTTINHLPFLPLKIFLQPKNRSRIFRIKRYQDAFSKWAS